jgi:hypothetical protein
MDVEGNMINFLKNKLKIATVLIIILIVSITAIFIIFSNPKRIINDKFLIELPKNTKITEFDNEKDYTAAKISISDKDFEQLKVFIEKNYDSVNFTTEPYKYTGNGWSLPKDKIVYHYVRNFSVQKILFIMRISSDRSADIYVLKSTPGQMVLYLFIDK